MRPVVIGYMNTSGNPFIIHPLEDWPPLAWLAVCRRGERTIAVLSGHQVEVTPEWFCEAVWAGSFREGNFDTTDLVMGSGARCRDGIVTFVSSGTTVDRLHSLECEHGVLVSNSLPCLLESAGATVDPAYSGYYYDFRTVIYGLRRVKRRLATSKGDVTLTYFDNLAWDGDRLSVRPKPYQDRHFSCYSDYRSFLQDSLKKVNLNLSDPERRYVYAALGTVSSGYDSSAVAAMCRAVGLKKVIAFGKARGGSVDDGSPIAKRLGLDTIKKDREQWRRIGNAIVPFATTNAYGEEVHFSSLQSQLSRRVLYTGFHGGAIWAKELKEIGPDLVRGDPSGLSLSEYRLWTGFIHCPVPFFGARSAEDVSRISNSEEMKPWDVFGNYSRPIPRRIAEEAGVPRDMFGMHKKAASVTLWGGDSVTDWRGYEGYVQWLREHRTSWETKRRLDPFRQQRRDRAFAIVGILFRPIWRSMLSRQPSSRASWRLQGLAGKRPDPLFLSIFPWALEQAKLRYSSLKGKEVIRKYLCGDA